VVVDFPWFYNGLLSVTYWLNRLLKGKFFPNRSS
jgi:hypothetical protein